MKCNVAVVIRNILGKQNVPGFQEHVKHFKSNRYEKSSVAQHIQSAGCKIPTDDFKLIRNISSYRQLDSFESIYIYAYEWFLHEHLGPIPKSQLFECFT